MPNLITLRVELPQTKVKDAIDESQIIQFLLQNHNIEVLQIRRASSKLLKEINEILPKLESLDVIGLADYYMNDEEKLIRFLTLKYFMLFTKNDNELLPNVAFSHLQTLNLDLSSDFNENWMDFLTNRVNKNLHEFILNCADLTANQLSNISEYFTDLSAANFDCNCKMLSHDILNFIKQSKMLRNLELVIHIDSTDQEYLDKVLIPNWNIRFTPHSDGRMSIQIKLAK